MNTNPLNSITRQGRPTAPSSLTFDTGADCHLVPYHQMIRALLNKEETMLTVKLGEGDFILRGKTLRPVYEALQDQLIISLHPGQGKECEIASIEFKEFKPEAQPDGED